MNKRTYIATTLAVMLTASLGVLGCQQAAAPTPAADVTVVQPKLLDLKLDQALRNQESLVERADKLKPDERLPMPVAHSAGAAATAALAKQEAAPAAPVSAEDKRSIAIWFSGNEIGETDPCG